jgi:hypothetical protein
MWVGRADMTDRVRLMMAYKHPPTYTHIYIYIHTHTHAHTHTHTYTHTHTHTHTPTHTQTHIQTPTHIHIHAPVCMCVHSAHRHPSSEVPHDNGVVNRCGEEQRVLLLALCLGKDGLR